MDFPCEDRWRSPIAKTCIVRKPRYEGCLFLLIFYLNGVGKKTNCHGRLGNARLFWFMNNRKDNDKTPDLVLCAVL